MLAVSTIFLLHGAGRADLDALARFLRLRPCYRLVLGADVADSLVQPLPATSGGER